MSICNNSSSACAKEVGIGNPHGLVFIVPLPGPMHLEWVILSGLCLHSSCLGPGAWDGLRFQVSVYGPPVWVQNLGIVILSGFCLRNFCLGVVMNEKKTKTSQFVDLETKT